MTKRLLFVLITIVMYLPMAVVVAMPVVNTTSHHQSVAMMDMSKHLGHDQQTMNEKCGHCADQHTCKSTNNSCSTHFGIAPHSVDVAISQYNQIPYAQLTVRASVQHTFPLLRPPITA